MLVKMNHLAKNWLPAWIRLPIRRARFKMGLLKRAAADRWDRKNFGGFPLPPPILRYRVDGSFCDGSIFLHLGLNCAQDLRSALKRAGRAPLYENGRVLDFGCGCGRILRWFHDAPSTCRITGVDIDAEAVAWCRRHYPFASFEVMDPLPPLRFEEGAFDLVMVASVLSHLDAPLQDQWIAELHRICRPGGIVLVSFLGRLGRNMLDSATSGRVEKEGFLFFKVAEGPFKLDGMPDSYQLAFQTRDDAVARCSARFRLIEYIEGGLANFEDLAILEK